MSSDPDENDLERLARLVRGVEDDVKRELREQGLEEQPPDEAIRRFYRLVRSAKR